MPAPIDPSFATGGLEWQVPGIGLEDGVEAAQPQTGFDGMLGRQLQSLTDTQSEAADAARSLAEGTATDPESVVMAIERARLSMQLASQIRTKAVEAAQDIFHTQI